MTGDGTHRAVDKKLAAVCGLPCEACTMYIASTDDPARLKMFAARYQLPEEEIKCFGCRSEKRTPSCDRCKMCSCAAERGVEFCVECAEYPCADIKKFQSEMPHRIELWDDLEQIKNAGCENWLKTIRENYACPQCGVINSAYDAACRKCGHEPSCEYVAKHKDAVEAFMKGR